MFSGFLHFFFFRKSILPDSDSKVHTTCKIVSDVLEHLSKYYFVFKIYLFTKIANKHVQKIWHRIKKNVWCYSYCGALHIQINVLFICKWLTIMINYHHTKIICHATMYASSTEKYQIWAVNNNIRRFLKYGLFGRKGTQACHSY